MGNFHNTIKLMFSMWISENSPPSNYRFIEAALSLGLMSFTGCVLAPAGTAVEEEALSAAGKVYDRAFDDRVLPEIPPSPDAYDILGRAFLANGELEASYYRWAAAFHRIQEAGGYPNTPLSTSFSYMFSSENIRAIDRTTVTIGPDAMENLAFPPKVYQAAKVALDEARAAGKDFTAKKFDTRRQVLTAWNEYSLTADLIRVGRENVSLLKLASDTAVNRVQAGGQQLDLVKAETEYRLAENQLHSMEAKLLQQRALLNSMIAREPNTVLAPPDTMPPPRPLPADDTVIFDFAAKNNPELAAFAHRVTGREDALELARLQYIPDFNPFGGFTGTVSQMIGIGISIPTFLPAVSGKVNEARAELQEMMAMYRQSRFDKAGSVVAALYALRNSERQVSVYEDQILPAAKQVVNLARPAYEVGSGSFLDLIEAQRTLLVVRTGLSEARAAREQSVAELEALLGVNIEELNTLSSKVTAAESNGNSEKPN